MDLGGRGEGREFRMLVCTGLYEYIPTKVKVQQAQTMQWHGSPLREEAGWW